MKTMDSERKTIEFVVVFWGTKYREFFAQFCLPSLLAPDNMPVFSGDKSGGFKARLIIASTAEDYVETQKVPLFQDLLKHVEVEFIDIGLPGRLHPQLHMSRGHKLALYGIIERKSYGLVLAPDILLSNGSIATILRYLANGAKHILLPALRFDLDKSIAGLRAIEAFEIGKPLSVSGRTLAKIGTEALHSELKRFEFDRDHYSDFPISTYFEDPGRGLLFHTTSYAIVTNFSELRPFDPRQFDEDTIDAHFINDYIFGLPGIVVLNDTDEFFMYPLTSEEDMPQEHLILPDPYLTQDAARTEERKLSYLRRLLFEKKTSDGSKRWLVRFPVRIHYSDLQEGHDPIASRAIALIDKALVVQDLPKPIHFVTQIRNRNELVLFLTVCLPSLLSPQNLPQLAGVPGCKLTIIAPMDQHEFISSYGSVRTASSFIDIECSIDGSESRMAIDQGIDLEACRAAIAFSAGVAYASFVDPRTLYSEGTITRLIELIKAGKDFALAAMPTYKQLELTVELERWRYLMGNRPLQIGGEELVRASLGKLSNGLRKCDWTNPNFPDAPDGLFLEAPGGLVLHTTRWAILLFRLDDSAVGIDETLREAFGTSAVYLTQDSDEINLVTLDQDAQNDNTDASAPLPYWARQVVLSNYVAGLTEMQRHLFSVPVCLHMRPMTDVWDAVAATSRLLVSNFSFMSRSVGYNQPKELVSAFDEPFVRRFTDGSIVAPLRVSSPLTRVVRRFFLNGRFRDEAIKRALRDPLWLLRSVWGYLRRF